MNADDILKIIRAIPEYITYIYPGYLTIYVYYFLRGKTLKDTNSIVIKSLAISYVCISILDIVVKKAGISSMIFENVILIFLAVLGAYIAFRVVKASRIHKFLEWMNVETTFYDNEMETLAEFNKGAWLIVYLKDDNVIYEGSLGYKEMETDKRQYITLQAYKKYFLDDRGKEMAPGIVDYTEDYKEVTMIFYDSIKRIEKRHT